MPHIDRYRYLSMKYDLSSNTLSLSLSDIPNRNLLEMIQLPSSLDSSPSWRSTQMGPKNRLSFTGLSFAGLHLILGGIVALLQGWKQNRTWKYYLWLTKMEKLDATQPINSSSESEHDNMTSPDPSTSTGKRQTRSLSKWYLNTPAGFSPRDWQAVKEHYNTLDKVEQGGGGGGGLLKSCPLKKRKCYDNANNCTCTSPPLD